MRTVQCGTCLRYRGALKCDAFPRGIPEDILTGKADHTKPYKGDGDKRFKSTPEMQEHSDADAAMLSAHVDQVIEREDIALRRVKEVLKAKGYTEEDFDAGGPLHGYAINELIDLASVKR